jgi:ubiquinone/menaquinone biosynthesis C-methylase UbiE
MHLPPVTDRCEPRTDSDMIAGAMSQKDLVEPRTPVFDRIAPGYDAAALRFYPFCADHMIIRLKPARGSKILDVATGTGAVALAATQAIGESGRVTAIDLSEGMLGRLQEKIDKFGIRNIDLHVMDGAALEFRRDYFDDVVCSFGLTFLSDMSASLKEWARVTKPGGRVMFSVFGSQAFQPMRQLLAEHLRDNGVALPDSDAPGSVTRLADPGRCRDLLHEAGLEETEVITEQFGYRLENETQWWEVVWNGAMRAWIEKIPPQRSESFRSGYLNEVRPLMKDDGLWLNVETHLCTGKKPRSSGLPG